MPSPPQIAEGYDLEDAQTDAARPTAQLITITVNKDGTASFALPRMEVGQGITTSTAMIIAEELDLPVEKVHVTLAPARPELMLNQLTGGSNTTVSTYTPIRVAAAIAKGALLEAAALELGSVVALLKSKNGVITAPDGSSATYGELAEKAASPTTKKVDVQLKGRDSFAVIGTPQNRVDAHDIVTGQEEVRDGPRGPRRDADDGVPRADAERHPEDAAQRGRRPRDARRHRRGPDRDRHRGAGARPSASASTPIRAMDVDWNPGTVEGESDDTILAKVRKAELPLAVPKVPGRWPRRSRPTSPSCSAAAPRSSRTPPSPTCAPTTPPCGPG